MLSFRIFGVKISIALLNKAASAEPFWYFASFMISRSIKCVIDEIFWMSTAVTISLFSLMNWLTIVDVKITDLVWDWCLIAHQVWVVLALRQNLHLLILFAVVAVTVISVRFRKRPYWSCCCRWFILLCNCFRWYGNNWSTLSRRLSPCRLLLRLCWCRLLLVPSSFNLHEVGADEDVVTVMIQEVECSVIDPDVIQANALIELQLVQVLFASLCKLILLYWYFILSTSRHFWLVVLLFLQQDWHVWCALFLDVQLSIVLAWRGFPLFLLNYRWSSVYGHNRFSKLLNFHLDDDLLQIRLRTPFLLNDLLTLRLLIVVDLVLQACYPGSNFWLHTSQLPFEISKLVFYVVERVFLLAFCFLNWFAFAFSWWAFVAASIRWRDAYWPYFVNIRAATPSLRRVTIDCICYSIFKHHRVLFKLEKFCPWVLSRLSPCVCCIFNYFH